MFLGVLLLTCAAVLTLSNIRRQNEGGEEAAQVLEELREKIETKDDTISAPDESLPEASRTMPTVEIDGVICVGAVQIPSLELQLPVIRDWNYDNLKKAPCLYYGSV